MSHISSEELISRLNVAKSKVEVGGKYYHYKSPDKFYTIVDVAMLEATEEVAVIYRAEYDEMKGFIWIRTLENFLEEVEFEGQKVQRFKKVIE